MTLSAIVVIGGNSRLGQAIVRRLGDRALPISRAADGNPRTLVLPDYQAVSATMLSGASAVINCTGLVMGPVEDLEEANSVLPAHLAAQTRQAGVPRFVHISSFSVYGGAECIDANTPPAPTTDYGRTKLAGDQAIAKLADASFLPASLRIPMLVDATSDNKLAELARFALRIGFMPAAAQPVRRAMLSYEAAGAAAISLAASQEIGAVLAADPVPFTYELLAERIFAVTDRRVRMVTPPRPLMAVLRKVRPTLFASLFQSCYLPPRFNFVRETATEASLSAVITRMIEKAALGSA